MAKKASRDPKREALMKQFQESFTDEQKVAIIGSLVSMAMADGIGDQDEAQVAAFASKLLGKELSKADLDRYFNDPLYYLDRLKSLDEAQKRFYVQTLWIMITADGKVEVREISKLQEYMELIGVDPETLKRYIDEMG